MIRRPPRSTQSRSSAASDVYKRQPIQWPCFYGIDFPTREELVAVGRTIEDVCAHLGADSLGHISLEGMLAATQISESRLCTACFTGKYPIGPPADERHQLVAQGAEVA